MKTSEKSVQKSSNSHEPANRQVNRSGWSFDFECSAGIMQENYFRPGSHGYFFPTGSVSLSGLCM